MLAYEDVDKLIAQFGGLRPMAKALAVPVPTVQGWKKRGRVPPEHHEALAAQLALLAAEQAEKQQKTTIQPQAASPLQQKMLAQLDQPNPLNTSYWVWVGVASVAGVCGGLALLTALFFAPNLRDALGWHTPTHTQGPTPAQQWLARLDVLETQLQALSENDVARANALAKLQQARMALNADSPDAAKNIKELQTQMAVLQTQLDKINKQKQDVGENLGVLQQLAQRDSKAATLLLVASQLQQIFQGQGAFASELPKLKTLLADFPPLVATLDKLAPFAETGVPSGARIQTNIQRRAVAYSQTQAEAQATHTQAHTPEEAGFLASIQKFSQRFVVVKKDNQVVVGQTPTMPPQVPQAIEKLEQKDYAGSLNNLQKLPPDWQHELADSMQALEGRVLMQKLLNQVWHASAQLVRGQKLGER